MNIFNINLLGRWLEWKTKFKANRKYLKYKLKSKCAFKLYKTNDKMHKLFLDCIESGVVKVSNQDSHYTKATFDNGVKVDFWKSNYPYAYASNAHFTLADGSKVSFRSEMPEYWLVFYLKEVCDKFENQK